MNNLERVYDNIARFVLEFCGSVGSSTFHAKDLVEYVQTRVPVAPNSPCRILQVLKKERKVNYEVLNRKQSLYKIVPMDI